MTGKKRISKECVLLKDQLERNFNSCATSARIMENIRHTETWRLCTQIRLIFTQAKRKQQKEIDANDTGISEQNLLRNCVTACIPQREIYHVLKTSHIFCLYLLVEVLTSVRKKVRIRYTWMQSNHFHVLWRSKGSHSIPALHTFA